MYTAAMKLKSLTLALLLTVSIFIGSKPSFSRLSVSIDEKYGTKTIFASARLKRNVVVIATAYMGKDTAKNKWVSAKFVSMVFFTSKGRGKTAARPAISEWKLLKPRDKVSIYTPNRKVEGYIYAQSGDVFSLVMQSSNFKSFACSDKATIVCRKTKIIFDRTALIEMRDMADEMEKEVLPTKEKIK